MIFNNVEKQISQLLENFKEFQITDLIGFARILDVEEKDNFADYCTDICIAFSKENARKRKQLLKLAKDIKVANQNMVPPHSSKESVETSLN